MAAPIKNDAPGGTTREELEDAFLENPDIHIPTAERQREEEDDAIRRTNPEEDTVAGERKRRRPTEEESRPEQLTDVEALDGESPEAQRLPHIPGGAWLKQVWSCLQSRLNALVGNEEGEREKGV
ncbi:hypothetical protein NDU88_003202 [Pleurodeles waltl]|uniref:Uncharacterized protein n=1 Tax=Pleurodeles waltl TaxID=8319 RepID=A0AAV7UZC6_PLEWA|nr:hypothetical protein NDU88_003202 [Pleurodeles waltl]